LETLNFDRIGRSPMLFFLQCIIKRVAFWKKLPTFEFTGKKQNDPRHLSPRVARKAAPELTVFAPQSRCLRVVPSPATAS